MKKTYGTLFGILFLAGVASAGDLRIIGQDLQWSPTVEPSLQYLLGVENATGTTDPLVGWQLKLEIIPGADSTGTVEFHSASVPPDYLLEGNSLGILLGTFPPSFSPTGTTGVIGDGEISGLGIEVPPTGENLLQVNLVASPDAAGRFCIAVVPGESDGASWLSNDYSARDYENVPFGGGPVTVGSVFVGVAVPEPSGILLLTLGIAVFLCWASVCRRERKP